jgi:hypothetical protein
MPDIQLFFFLQVQNMRGLVSDTPPALLDDLPSGSGTLVPSITPRAGPGSPFSARYGEDHQAAWAKQEQLVSILSPQSRFVTYWCS